MIKRVLVIGGYGNFGRFISTKLAEETNIQVIIGGRNPEKGNALVETLAAVNKPEVVKLDIFDRLDESLLAVKPDIVIHTSGPFQSQTYVVAQACIDYGCHYIDLADGREFVTGMSDLNENAAARKVLVVTGASSVPALTCAIIDEYKNEFAVMSGVDYALTIAQITGEGFATTKAIMTYVGKPFSMLKQGKLGLVYGWQSLRLRKFWKLNYRALGNCNISDYDILPTRYPDLETIRFQAGAESKIQHVGLYFLSYLVRMKLIKSLAPWTNTLLTLSKLFNPFSSGKSGYFLTMSGISTDGKPKQLEFNLVASQQHGQHIPCIPSILIAKKLANHEMSDTGVSACVGMISLDDYLNVFKEFDIEWQTTGRGV